MVNDTPHGGDIYSQEILWDFSVNLNPLGMPKSVKEAVCQAAEYCSRYPDIQCRELTAAMARHYNALLENTANAACSCRISENNILCANGAADLIYQTAFALRPNYALLPAPTFSEYELALCAAGCQVFHYFFQREQGFAIEVKALIEEAKKRKMQGQKPEIIFICNPNNPTGLTVKKTELEILADFAERECIRLVVDECFLDFLEEPEQYSLVPVLNNYPHLVIISAFTKLYGMAGLRLGYGLSADTALFASIRQIRQPWSVSVPAQMAGIAALKEKAYRQKARSIIAQGRIQLSAGLRKLGFLVYPSQANYIFFQDLREGAENGSLYRACREKKLLLRSCANIQGLDGSYYRICIKTKEENEQLLLLLSEILAVDVANYIDEEKTP